MKNLVQDTVSPQFEFILSSICTSGVQYICLHCLRSYQYFTCHFVLFALLALSPSLLMLINSLLWFDRAHSHHLVPLLHPHWYYLCLDLSFLSSGQLQKPPNWSPHHPTHTLTSFRHSASSSGWNLNTEQGFPQSMLPLTFHTLSSLISPSLVYPCSPSSTLTSLHFYS